MNYSLLMFPALVSLHYVLKRFILAPSRFGDHVGFSSRMWIEITQFANEELLGGFLDIVKSNKNNHMFTNTNEIRTIRRYHTLMQTRSSSRRDALWSALFYFSITGIIFVHFIVLFL